MFRKVQIFRCYCQSIAKSQLPLSRKRETIDYQKLRHPSKVPENPITQEFPAATSTSDIVIDSKTIQLLERLSLVDLDSKEALATLKSSIQFAKKIEHIDTTNVAPLYTVLEGQNLNLRADKVTEGNCREDVLRNAKVTDEDYFVSPPGNIPLEQEEKNLE